MIDLYTARQMRRDGPSMGTLPGAPAAHPISSPPDFPLPADGGFFVEGAEKASANSRDSILITQQDVQREMECLMTVVPIFDKLIRHFKKGERRIEEMLAECNINRHDFAHQQRVAGMAMALGRFFHIPEDRLTAIGLAASVHDMGYEWPEGVPRSDITKKHFDNHAGIGARIFMDLFDHPDFRLYFLDWTDDMKRDAYLAIKYHNGGSHEEYRAYRSQIPLGPKLVRAADHIDNVQDRIRWPRIKPTLREKDSAPDHRLVPASIADVSVLINRTRKLIEIHQKVDRSDLERHFGRIITVSGLREGFRKAYGRKIAGVKEIFEDALQYPATDKEHLRGTIVWQLEGGREEYDPIPTQ